MKKAVLFSAIGLLASGAVGAVEAVGRVISSTPVIQQVAVPRQVCNNQPMVVQQPNSGAGAVLGAIAGGVLGNQIGHGAGRAVATGVGLVGGAAVGNSIEGPGSSVQNVQQCTTQTFYENRTVAYNVTYEYAGHGTHRAAALDPGATIRLELTPMAGASPPACGRGSPTPALPAPRWASSWAAPPAQPVMVAPPVAYTTYYPAAYPAYPAYPHTRLIRPTTRVRTSTRRSACR